MGRQREMHTSNEMSSSSFSFANLAKFGQLYYKIYQNKNN